MIRSGAWRVAVLVLLILITPGCKKKTAAGPASNPPASASADNTRSPLGGILPSVGRLQPENDLNQFAKLYLIEAMTKPPKSLADMSSLRRDLPKAFPAFEDGRYVVLWGADPNHAPAGASQTVLAYEKATPEKGGVVAFLDGSVRNVTAQEFQTLAKPGAR